MKTKIMLLAPLALLFVVVLIGQSVFPPTAGTATALAANGSNCSAGQYARGVDASGAAENCTAAYTGQPLETRTASSSAQLDFTTCFSSTYDLYEIVLDHLLPATDGAALQMLASTNGGSSYDTGTNYTAAYWGWTHAGQAASGGLSQSNWSPTGDNGILNTTANGGYSGKIVLSGLNNTSSWKHFYATGGYMFNSGSHWAGMIPTGGYKSTSVMNAVRFKMSSGNIASGTGRCYPVVQ